ncbi:MAG TPA: hypothetical protein PKK43_13070, partial [Spirochaetota bacterium]|nr:hypothetical protein [Spirochaetota bacterium]
LMSGGFFHHIQSSAIQIVYRNKTPLNYVLSTTFSCIGFTIIYLLLFQAGRIVNLRCLIYHDITASFLAGP